MALELIPLREKIIVQPIEADAQLGSILIPETSKERPQRGYVVNCGMGRMLESGTQLPLSVELGDLVLFGKYSGSEFEFLGKRYFVLDESDLLAVIREKKDEANKG